MQLRNTDAKSGGNDELSSNRFGNVQSTKALSQ